MNLSPDLKAMLPIIFAWPSTFSQSIFQDWCFTRLKRRIEWRTLSRTLDELCKSGIIEEVDTDSYWYGTRYQVTGVALLKLLPEMARETIAYCSDKGKYYNSLYADNLDEYWRWLKSVCKSAQGKLVSPDTSDFAQLLSYARTNNIMLGFYINGLLDQTKISPLVLALDPICRRLLFSEFKSVAAYRALKPDELKAPRQYFQSADNAKAIDDWFLLNADFVSTGQAQVLADQSTGLTEEALILQTVALLQAQKYKEAGKMAIAAHKCIGSRSPFESPLLNFIFGAALFAAKDQTTILKRCQALLRSSSIKYASALPLKLFIQAAMDQEFTELPYVRHIGPANNIYIRLTAAYLHIQDPDNGLVFEPLREQNNFLSYLAWRLSGQYKPKETAAFTGLDFLPPNAVKPYWQKLIDNLLTSRKAQGKDIGAADQLVDGKERIIYRVETARWEVYPVLQKSKGAKWTKGAVLSPGKFKELRSPFMSALDKDIAACVRTSPYNKNVKYLMGSEVIALLVDHPNVYFSNEPDLKMEIVSEPLQLTVKKDAHGSFDITSNLASLPEPGVYLKLDGTRVSVMRVTESQSQALMIVRQLKSLPSEAEGKLTEMLESLSTEITVHSPLLKDSSNLEHVKGQSKITFQFTPSGNDEYSVRAVVRPLAESPLLCQPGVGQESVTSTLKGKPVLVQRSLSAEKKNWSSLEAALKAFDDCQTSAAQWELSTVNCLEMLEKLREHSKHSLIEWPEGVKLKVNYSPLSFGNMKVSVHRLSQWFEVDASAQIKGKTLLKMREILDKLREAKGDFIALGDQEYIKITSQLRKQLEHIDRVASNAAKGAVKLSVFNAAAIDQLEEDGAEVVADKAFNELIEKISAASKLNPQVPVNLQCELRDYQVEGYEWLSRLAHWEAGACLADDMGLGKTVQTIALLLSRTQEGPSIIAMPTAVLYNWQEELNRFAPTLHQIVLNKEDREVALKSLKAGDVVLVTYGVLTKEIEKLSTIEWNCAVLDEAHTIKNRETKMSKSAMQLSAKFRLLLTGTPIQNHLHEIWNLFQFAVPGLLGSFNQFSERFILPIERDHDKEAQRQLKRVLSPFILRRTKSEVLQELPGKTEITIKVELSEAERALYEALRVQTTEQLASGEINTIQALAYLTKLRLAACAAQLADAKLKIPSSKTAALVSLVQELIKNKHRALVFSQFTSHLALIKAALDKEGITYQYLDGSDTAATRIKRVEEFQNGNEPLFLISLKAGGTGLNLTAADYVIHLDPWWNPAIEDQASDRTYRIGQDRPVTIYRLISEGTIEEKIVQMHLTKKNLADALLEGTDIARTMSKDEILQLLQGN